MAIYEYGGKTYELADGTSNEVALSKIKASLGEASAPPVQAAPAPGASNEAPTNSFLMGLKDPISGGAQLLPRGLEQITSLGGIVPNMMSRFFGSEAERVDAMVKQEQAGYASQRAAAGGEGLDLGRIAGNIINPANLIGGVRAAPVLAGGIQGALQPATSDSFATEKATQVGLGALGGRVGELVAKGAGRVLSPLQSKAEATMRELGVTPTMGQALGGAARKMEDFAQNLPLVGGSIRTARERVLFDFNKGIINKALAKVDDKLPASAVGRDAVAYAAEQVSNKYDDVLSKMSFNLDFKTTSGILNALDTASLSSAAQREQASSILNNTVLSKFSGKQLTGAEYKAIESDLSKQAASYASSSTAGEREVGQALKGVLDVFKKELYQQNPKFTSQLRRVDSAFGDLKTMERAAAAGGAVNGVFTPAQYNTAVRQADQSRNKARFARGQARNQDVSEAAMEVIGKDASSTLEGRLAMGGLGGIAVFSQPQIAIPAAVAAGAAYSPVGSRVTDALLRSRAPVVSQFGQQVRQAAPAAGMLSGGLTLDAYR
jgi:hypothetical protein